MSEWMLSVFCEGLATFQACLLCCVFLQHMTLNGMSGSLGPILQTSDIAGFQNSLLCLKSVSLSLQVLATGLSALYSSLPRKIDVQGDDWHALRQEDWMGVSSLRLFMNSLEFCNAVVQVAHPLVRTQLLDYLHNGFLVPVMGTALHTVGAWNCCELFFSWTLPNSMRIRSRNLFHLINIGGIRPQGKMENLQFLRFLILEWNVFIRLLLPFLLCVSVVIIGRNDCQHCLPGSFSTQHLRDFPAKNLPVLYSSASSWQRYHPGHTTHTHQWQFKGMKYKNKMRLSSILSSWQRLIMYKWFLSFLLHFFINLQKSPNTFFKLWGVVSRILSENVNLINFGISL